MDADLLEQQLSIWTRRVYMAMISAGILLVASIDELRWVAWFMLQILTTSLGFYLLWGKDWRSLPLSKERINTIFGSFLASWLLLFVPMILAREACLSAPLLGYTIFLLIIYLRTRKKLSDSEEMFP